MPSTVVHGYELAVKMHGYDGYDVLVGFTLLYPLLQCGLVAKKGLKQPICCF